jgi:hypothetical protein
MTPSPSPSPWTPAAGPGTSRPASALDSAVPLPAVLDLVQAAALLGLGRTTAYRLVHDEQWPTPVLRLGRLIKIPTQPLLDLLAGTTRGRSVTRDLNDLDARTETLMPVPHH